jgi:hypothetical protein
MTMARDTMPTAIPKLAPRIKQINPNNNIIFTERRINSYF